MSIGLFVFIDIQFNWEIIIKNCSKEPAGMIMKKYMILRSSLRLNDIVLFGPKMDKFPELLNYVIRLFLLTKYIEILHCTM